MAAINKHFFGNMFSLASPAGGISFRRSGEAEEEHTAQHAFSSQLSKMV